MASNNDDRQNNFPGTGSTCGPPKAQLSLQKILLHPISSTTPQLPQVHVNAFATSSSSSTSSSLLNVSEFNPVPMGYNFFDLNLPPPPETHNDSPSPALHGAEKVQECNLKSPEEKKGTSVLQDENSENEMETNNVALGNNLERTAESKDRTEIEEVGEREERKGEIWFGALLDAVECAMEEYGGKPSEHSKRAERNESNGKKRQRVKWKTGEEEEEEETMKKVVLAAAAVAAAAEEVSTSPVVKSNRGRTQVLPCKYRDSVIEPLTHLSSRHSRSSSTLGPTKRRPR